MADFTPLNPPTKLSMIYGTAAFGALGSLAKSCRFAVRILPSGSTNILTKLKYTSFMNDLTYVAESTEMPGRAFTFEEIQYYGPTKSMPYKSEYQPLDVTFLCRTESYERQFFDDWMEIINPTNSFDFNYRSDYISEITVYQLSEYANDSGQDAVATYAWTLHEAYPIVVNPQPVTWADNDVQRLTVSFSYRYWDRKGQDTAPKTTPIATS